ncbi:MAG TPA: hypothetical protein VGF95_06295 [Solirubrobacteraceae bacterium]
MPETIVAKAGQLAEELGTTVNDAIVRLAQDGASARERREQIATLASERRAAVERASLSDALSFPLPEELHEAMLAGRRDL